MGAREEELKPERKQEWERVQNRVRQIAEMDAGQRAMEILRVARVWILSDAGVALGAGPAASQRGSHPE